MWGVLIQPSSLLVKMSMVFPFFQKKVGTNDHLPRVVASENIKGAERGIPKSILKNPS